MITNVLVGPPDNLILDTKPQNENTEHCVAISPSHHTEYQTYSWASLLLDYVQIPGEIKHVYIFSLSGLNTEKILFLLRISNKDTVFSVRDACDKAFTLVQETLTSKGYFEGVSTVFHGFMMTEFSKSRPNTSTLQSAISTDTTFKRVVVTYTSSLDRKTTISSIDRFMFQNLLEDEVFLQKIADNQLKLLVDKRKFYTSLLVEVKRRIAILVRKAKGTSRSGFDRDESFPMISTYQSLLVEIEDILDVCDQRAKSISLENTRKNLHDAYYNEQSGLMSLVGREDIKNEIATKIYAFSNCHTLFLDSFHNFALLGKSGVGKTHIAKVVAYVFSRVGILLRNERRYVTRADLVGGYLGQTAPRTRSVLYETLEGVLFIDEAYQLTISGNEQDFYGSECISEIVNFLDKHIGMSIVIVAGYEEEMETKFFPMNQGLSRRFPFVYRLGDYSAQELTVILLRFLEQRKVVVPREFWNVIYTYVLNLVESNPRAVEKQAGDMLNMSTLITTLVFSKSNAELTMEILQKVFTHYMTL